MREKLVLTTIVALILFSSILLFLGCFLIAVTDQPGSLSPYSRFAFYTVYFAAPVVLTAVALRFFVVYRREHQFEHFVEGMPGNVVDAYSRLKLQPGAHWQGRECNPLAVLARSCGVEDSARLTRCWATEVLKAPFCGGFVDAWEHREKNDERARNTPEYKLGYEKGVLVRAALNEDRETETSTART